MSRNNKKETIERVHAIEIDKAIKGFEDMKIEMVFVIEKTLDNLLLLLRTIKSATDTVEYQNSKKDIHADL